jgi:hypothetical protein
LADEASIPPSGGGKEPPPPDSSSTKDASAELVALARQAFQEKRRKDCLLLTRVILTIDAENKEAQVIETWVRSDLEKDIVEVRAVLEQASNNGDGELFQRAEWMLRSILRIDKDNPQATAMLEEIRPSKAGFAVSDSAADSRHLESDGADLSGSDLMDEYPGYPPEPTNRQRRFILLAIALALPIAGLILWKYDAPTTVPVTAPSVETNPVDPRMGILDISLSDGVQVFINDGYRGTTPLEPMKLLPNVYRLKYMLDGKEVGSENVTVTAGNLTRNSFRELQGRLVFVVVPASGVQLKIDSKSIGPAPESAKVNPGQHQLEFSADGYAPEVRSVSAIAGEKTTVAVLLKPLSGTAGPKPNTPAGAPASAADVGTLLVTSPLVVDIYEKDVRLGTSPKILELSAGPHTLEFRFEGLKKTATYPIEKGVSQTAKVTFEIKVNINAAPFADVIIDSDPQIPLGQTPLNQVTVPVGGTLIFRHPSYPEKKWRVASTDNNIPMRFP